MLSNLVSSSGETIKETERLIKSPDAETKLTYEVEVDPLTGRQKIIEKFTTTKRECAICSGYFAQIHVCADCGALVCTSDARLYSWPEYEYNRPYNPDREYDPDRKIIKSIIQKKTVCKTCAKQYGITD
jgi:hypothetical protein